MLSTTGSLASTLGTVQPFRYRGYVYDEETGLYYLKSRYYNTRISRFINIDTCLFSSSTPTSLNGFCYCDNSPIIFCDSDGSVRLYGLEVAFYGFFHTIVQNDIVKLNPGMKTEQHPNSTSRLRIDLLCENEMYEIKPNNTVSKAMGNSQLEKYKELSNNLYELGDAKKLKIPVYKPLTIGDYTIQLSVMTEGALILYSVTCTPKQPDHVPSSIPVIVKTKKFDLNSIDELVRRTGNEAKAAILAAVATAALMMLAGRGGCSGGGQFHYVYDWM